MGHYYDCADCGAERHRGCAICGQSKCIEHRNGCPNEQKIQALKEEKPQGESLIDIVDKWPDWKKQIFGDQFPKKKETTVGDGTSDAIREERKQQEAFLKEVDSDLLAIEYSRRVCSKLETEADEAWKTYRLKKSEYEKESGRTYLPPEI